MKCYRLEDAGFREVQDPVTGDGDYDEEVRGAGYFPQVDSRTHKSQAASITIYSTEQPGKPMYYVDVMGFGNQMAVFVADDFLALLRTLRELQPLVAVMSLDQQSDIQVESIVARGELADRMSR